MKSKKVFLKPVAFLALTVLIVVSVVIYLFFFHTYHPNPPASLDSKAVITEVSGVPNRLNEIIPSMCDEVTVNDLKQLNFSISENYPARCDHYVIDEQNSVVNLFPGSIGSQVLLLKEVDQNAKAIYTQLFKSKGEYPSRDYELITVKKDGEIFFKYGGWDYFGNDHSGTLIYKMELDLK